MVDPSLSVNVTLVLSGISLVYTLLAGPLGSPEAHVYGVLATVSIASVYVPCSSFIEPG